jgi:hypothetical protein
MSIANGPGPGVDPILVKVLDAVPLRLPADRRVALAVRNVRLS